MHVDDRWHKESTRWCSYMFCAIFFILFNFFFFLVSCNKTHSTNRLACRESIINWSHQKMKKRKKKNVKWSNLKPQQACVCADDEANQDYAHPHTYTHTHTVTTDSKAKKDRKIKRHAAVIAKPKTISVNRETVGRSFVVSLLGDRANYVAVTIADCNLPNEEEKNKCVSFKL